MSRIATFAALGLLLCTSAYADERDDGTHQVELGSGVICDTQQQMERFVAALDQQDPRNAIQTVNTEQHDPTACVAASVAYMRGADLGTVRNKAGAFRMVQILVIGVRTPTGMLAVKPGTFVSVFKVHEIEV